MPPGCVATGMSLFAPPEFGTGSGAKEGFPAALGGSSGVRCVVCPTYRFKRALRTRCPQGGGLVANPLLLAFFSTPAVQIPGLAVSKFEPPRVFSWEASLPELSLLALQHTRATARCALRTSSVVDVSHGAFDWSASPSRKTCCRSSAIALRAPRDIAMICAIASGGQCPSNRRVLLRGRLLVLSWLVELRASKTLLKSPHLERRRYILRDGGLESGGRR